MNCPDCDAAPGELHQVGCNLEPCPKCRQPMMGCDCIQEPDNPSYPRRPWAGAAAAHDPSGPGAGSMSPDPNRRSVLDH